MAYIKPKLKYFTTVDFGKITYEENFFALLAEKNLAILEDRLIQRKWFRGEYRLIVSRPETAMQGPSDLYRDGCQCGQNSDQS